MSGRWYHSAQVWRSIAARIVPGFALANLAWEIGQLPLYTLWTEASAPTIAYAVIHCTAGDVIIGVTALAIALTMTRSGPVETWRIGKIAVITALSQGLFTVFSEWLNVHVLQSWAYSDLMPVVPVLGTGLSPLAQSLALPPIVLFTLVRVLPLRRG